MCEQQAAHPYSSTEGGRGSSCLHFQLSTSWRPWPCLTFQSSETAVLATQFLIPLAWCLLHNSLPPVSKASSLSRIRCCCSQPSHSRKLGHSLPFPKLLKSQQGKWGGGDKLLGYHPVSQRSAPLWGIQTHPSQPIYPLSFRSLCTTVRKLLNHCSGLGIRLRHWRLWEEQRTENHHVPPRETPPKSKQPFRFRNTVVACSLTSSMFLRTKNCVTRYSYSNHCPLITTF